MRPVTFPFVKCEDEIECDGGCPGHAALLVLVTGLATDAG